MGTMDIKTIIEERFINFMAKGISHSNSFISYVFKNTIMLGVPFFIKNINYTLNKHRILYNSIFGNKKIKLRIDLNESWKVNILKELIYFRDFNCFDILSKDEIRFLIDYLCLH